MLGFAGEAPFLDADVTLDLALFFSLSSVSAMVLGLVGAMQSAASVSHLFLRPLGI